ncbi:hypothetical protein V8D89_006473 [Ganoderma adspersum]
MPVLSAPPIAPIEPDLFDDDDEGWQDMPIVRADDDLAGGLDEEDQKKYHYVPPTKKDSVSAASGSNATGEILDVDYKGNEWRTKADQNESEYTRIRINEEDDSDEVHLRTRYLFDEDKAMTPLSQMQQTKDMLTEAQRVAYVGLCQLTTKEMVDRLKSVKRKELKKAIQNMELWALKIMGRLYYHMELATEEQKMIESLGQHGIEAKDLVPPLMTTHTVANPEYDPAEAHRQAELRAEEAVKESADISDNGSTPPDSPPPAYTSHAPPVPPKPQQTTAKVLEDTAAPTMPGVSTHLSAADKDVTLDIRWTVLCDLFLVLIADSVYDARSRVLLENVALKLGLGWLDVVKFERRVTETLEIQEGVEKLEQQDSIQGVQKNSKKRRYMMLGLATLGGGLVIGLSAGLLAPVIGAGLGAAFATVGIAGTSGFLTGVGGAAVITTGGVVTGSSIAARGMARRTQYVHTFDILPLHNHKRVNCIITVSGFMTGPLDDVRLPFSVLDPVIGDVFSVLWEPEMIRETGSALKILTGEVLTQLAQTALQATVMTALMSALQWPIILTKLGYLIDNPWSNALDRAKSAGSVLADVLIHRYLGVRPITLIGFSLGARVIFYALVELAKKGMYGVVQDVILLGATVTAPLSTWLEVRSAVSGRFVNGYARNDWVLNYLFRATSGGLNTVAGLRAIQNVPDLENVDVTDKIAGHMSYRTFMPLILDQLGFPVSADYFDEPEEPDFEGDRVVVKEGEEKEKKGWFGRKKKTSSMSQSVSRPPSSATFGTPKTRTSQDATDDDDLPPRESAATPTLPSAVSQVLTPPKSPSTSTPHEGDLGSSAIPVHAGFDFAAIQHVLAKSESNPEEIRAPQATRLPPPSIAPPTQRTGSAPPPILEPPRSPLTPKPRVSHDLPPTAHEDEAVAGPSNPRTGLSPMMPRSLSLNNVSAAEEADLPSFDTPTSSARQPTLTFAGNDGSFWPPNDPDPMPTSYGALRGYQMPSNLSAMPSTDVLSNPFASAESGGLRSDGLPAPPNNPFASAASPGLSFGGMDGSITFSPSATTPSLSRDPWAIGNPYHGGKKQPTSSTLDLNPWQN